MFAVDLMTTQIGGVAKIQRQNQNQNQMQSFDNDCV